MSGADNNRRTFKMRTVRTKVYKFSELTNKAQEKAIEQMRDINTNHAWYQLIIDNFKSTCTSFAVEDVFFSGFYSQGDGAMFEYSGVNKEFINSIIDELKIPTWKKAILKKCASVHATGKHAGHYYHKNTCAHSIYIECAEGANRYPNIDNLTNLYADEIESEITCMYAQLCTELYNTLEKEYDYLISDAAIKETIISNEYEFTGDGKQF